MKLLKKKRSHSIQALTITFKCFTVTKIAFAMRSEYREVFKGRL